jgi:hypothetical protein
LKQAPAIVQVAARAPCARAAEWKRHWDRPRWRRPTAIKAAAIQAHSRCIGGPTWHRSFGIPARTVHRLLPGSSDL